MYGLLRWLPSLLRLVFRHFTLHELLFELCNLLEEIIFSLLAPSLIISLALLTRRQFLAQLFICVSQLFNF